MHKHDKKAVIEEQVGIFFDADAMELAIDDLKAAGFEARDIGLLASEYAVRDQLDYLFEEVNPDTENKDTVQTAFVTRDTIGDTVHALAGSLYIVAGAVGSGAVVASAGILGGPVAAAIATTAVISGIGALLAGIAFKSDAEMLHEQVDEGHLLLFVRPRDEAHKQKALAILQEHGAFEPRSISYNPPAETHHHARQR